MVHATSAVALAVVALNAASTLAYPVIFGDEGLGMRSESEFTNIKRAADQAALPKGAHAPSATVSADPAAAASTGVKPPTGAAGPPSGQAGANAGALPTVEAIWAPRPTVCKAGETPHAKNANQRLYVKGKKQRSGGRRGRHGGASGAGSRKHGGHGKQDAQGMSPASSAAPSSTPALMPRAVAATPTQATKPTATESATGTPAAPTSAPGNGQGVKGNGKVTTITRKGRDGNSTVYHVHHGTKTRCYTQETGAVKGGQGAPGKGDASATPSPSAASGGPQKTPDATKPSSNTPVATGVGAPGKGTTSPKLAARYEELLERYYGEIDELD